MICRFLAGCFGAAPIAIVGGTYVDFWETIDRGIATAAFSGATFIGPVAGLVAGEFITKSHLGWRWTAWITLIMAVFIGIIGLLTVPETFAPVLLKRKAEKLRHETKNWALHATIDETPIHARSLLEKYFSKPWTVSIKSLFSCCFETLMTSRACLVILPLTIWRISHTNFVIDAFPRTHCEFPSCQLLSENTKTDIKKLIAMTLYSSLVYSILYLIFFAYPYSFQVVRGWKSGIASLPFLGIFVGIIICSIYMAIDTKTRFQRELIRSKKPVLPEARLPPMIIGSFILSSGLFWFAWTSDPNITWVPQVLSGIFIGCGIFLVFLPSQIYIVDTYLLNANSALAATACARALMAAGFPLFATQMYERLGVAWATSLLAFLCVAMIPFPILFYLYGEKLRMKGKFSFAI
jgi:DHA1 family multidrug resistance protein-like MFS transporter